MYELVGTCCSFLNNIHYLYSLLPVGKNVLWRISSSSIKSKPKCTKRLLSCRWRYLFVLDANWLINSGATIMLLPHDGHSRNGRQHNIWRRWKLQSYWVSTKSEKEIGRKWSAENNGYITFWNWCKLNLHYF